MPFRSLALSLGIAVCALLAATAVDGSGGLGFKAPTIIGKANVSDPDAGEIIYDRSDSTFWGRDHGGTWQALGSPGAVLPPGVILPFGGETAPTGFLIANGDVVPRETFRDLFDAIGTAFGSGDGKTTFHLPDLSGRFLRGVDAGKGRDPDRHLRTAMNPGGNSGDSVGSLQADGFQGHRHGQAFNLFGNMPGGTTHNIGGNPIPDVGRTSGVLLDPVTDGSNGVPRVRSETRPVNAYVTFIIKT